MADAARQRVDGDRRRRSSRRDFLSGCPLGSLRNNGRSEECRESEHVTDRQSRLAKILRDDFLAQFLGEVAEWPNVTDSKSVVLEKVPGVRIPPSPPLGAAQHTIRRSRSKG